MNETRRGQRVAEQLDGELRGAGEDRSRIVVPTDRKRSLCRDRAGIELLDGAVDRHARFLVAGHDRALDRCGASPARKERRVDVKPEIALEQRVGNEQSVGANDHRVDVERELGGRSRRLHHVDAEARGDVFRR